MYYIYIYIYIHIFYSFKYNNRWLPDFARSNRYLVAIWMLCQIVAELKDPLMRFEHAMMIDDYKSSWLSRVFFLAHST